MKEKFTSEQPRELTTEQKERQSEAARVTFYEWKAFFGYKLRNQVLKEIPEADYFPIFDNKITFKLPSGVSVSVEIETDYYTVDDVPPDAIEFDFSKKIKKIAEKIAKELSPEE